MKNIIIIFSFLLSLNLSAQTAVKKSNISSCGGIVTNETTKIIYTVGETDLQEISNGTIHISEGFITPDILASSYVENYTENFEVSVFPNPVSDFITIKFSEISEGTITVSDINGKILSQYSFNRTNSQKIDFNKFGSGTYFLLLKNSKNKKFKSYTIIKD